MLIHGECMKKGSYNGLQCAEATPLCVTDISAATAGGVVVKYISVRKEGGLFWSDQRHLG